MIKKQMDRLDAGIKEAGEKVNRWRDAVLAESRAKEPNPQTIHELQLKLEHAQGLLQGLELAKYVVELGLNGFKEDLVFKGVQHLNKGETVQADTLQRVLEHVFEGKSL